MSVNAPTRRQRPGSAHGAAGRSSGTPPKPSGPRVAAAPCTPPSQHNSACVKGAALYGTAEGGKARSNREGAGQACSTDGLSRPLIHNLTPWVTSPQLPPAAHSRSPERHDRKDFGWTPDGKLIREHTPQAAGHKPRAEAPRPAEPPRHLPASPNHRASLDRASLDHASLDHASLDHASLDHANRSHPATKHAPELVGSAARQMLPSGSRPSAYETNENARTGSWRSLLCPPKIGHSRFRNMRRHMKVFYVF